MLETPATSCNNSGDPIPLEAIPAGGLWSGTGVTNNRFSPRQLPGDYLLTYKYNSSIGCQYIKTTLAKVVKPYVPLLSRSGNICLTGDVTVSLNNPEPDVATIIWMKKEPTETEFSIIQNGGNSVNIHSNGVVKVVAKTTYCLPEENAVIINDSFNASVSPGESSLEFCPNGEEKLTVKSDVPGISVAWKFYEQSVSDATTLSISDTHLRPEKTGYYYASFELGGCHSETSPQHVLILPADTLYVPNVFSPNGDNKNEVFRMINNDPSASFEVFNRYGKSVYVDSGNTGWDGGDLPAGVYFWYGVVANCHGDSRTIKGPVHLIR